jgi:hypothetical protein
MYNYGFKVEDGTGLIDSTSYVTVEEASAYHEARSRYSVPWDNYDEALQQNALMAATQAVDDQYGNKYNGDILYPETQALLWPRTAFTNTNNRPVDGGVIPNELRIHVMEVAMSWLNQVNIYSTDNREGDVASESITIGGAITESVSYFQPSSSAGSNTQEADIMLKPILVSSVSGITIKRTRG